MKTLLLTAVLLAVSSLSFGQTPHNYWKKIDLESTDPSVQLSGGATQNANGTIRFPDAGGKATWRFKFIDGEVETGSTVRVNLLGLDRDTDTGNFILTVRSATAADGETLPSETDNLVITKAGNAVADNLWITGFLDFTDQTNILGDQYAEFSVERGADPNGGDLDLSTSIVEIPGRR